MTGTSPIVVGVDGTDRSRDALALSIRLAEPDQPLLLAHVHQHGQLSSLLSAGDYERLVRDVADATFAAVQDTLPPDMRRQLRVISNRSIGAGLQELAEETMASFLVVGSSHQSGLGRVLAGSVTESVLTGAPVPVAVAPHGFADAERAVEAIGCGYDGSPESAEALSLAVGLARRSGAHLTVIAVHAPVAFGGVPSAGMASEQSANDALRAMRAERLDQAVAGQGDGVHVSGRLLEGDAAVELADLSAELDLLVLGSRGYGAVRSVLLGSVSRALVRSAACSVIVVPRGAAADAPLADPRA